MLHYANGREVVGDVTSLSKAIPVHMKCIDWYAIPQFSFDILISVTFNNKLIKKALMC